MILKSTKIIIDNNEIKFTIGDGTVVYKTDINSFEKKSGLTIHNIEFPIKGYYIDLQDISKTFSCGKIIDNLVLLMKKEYDDVLIIINFEGVEEISDNFFKSYTKFLLESNNKIITINMNTSITNSFGSFIKTNILEETE